MSASYIQLHLIIFIWLLTARHCLTSVIVKQDDDRVIIIGQDGTDDLECCMYGNCLCSNISLALEHLQDDTEIRIQSDISLHNIVVFGNVSNVKLVGDSNPTVRCDHQGGLVGKNINYIVIQGITWDSCNEITILNFSGVHIVKGAFLNSTHFALTLHGVGSVNINDSIFSHNNGSIDVLASSVYIYGSEFYGDRKTAFLVNVLNDDNNLTLQNILSNVTIEYCRFIDISEHCVYCIGSAGLMKNLIILYTNFTNNTNTAVNVEHCNVTLNNVIFYNNVNVNSGYINDGGAVRVYNGMLYMTGEVLFSYNRAGGNGGAIYLNHSVMFASQGSFLFHTNTAGNGGAVYIGQGSRLYVIHDKANLEFFNNTAASKGETMYIDLNDVKDTTDRYLLSSYYFDLLISINCTCHFSKTACTNNCAYFNTQLSSVHSQLEIYYPDQIASSAHCNHYIDSNSYNSTVNVYISNISTDGLQFWSHDLYLDVAIYDCYDRPIGLVNASFQCCSNAYTFPYNCTIDSQIGYSTFTVTDINSVIYCPNYNTITCNILVGNETSGNIYVTVQQFGHVCDDIAHAYLEALNAYCLPICSYIIPFISSEGNCVQQSILPGYWYDNAFQQFVTFCPIAYCNQKLHLDFLLFTADVVFPDRDVQCNANWSGLACGECNYSAGYAIKYDTTKCVPVGECLTTSVTSSLLTLFGVSLFYWIVVISFIFVLLHFRFDITAGYAYGLLFYYSVLEQIVNDVINYLDNNLESSEGYDIYDNYDNYEFEDYLDENDFMRFKILPILSSIGNLKPPFTEFMRLCLGDAEMIDHLMLQYIHPLIVSFLVFIIFILARNFVLVAGTIGRYVNTRSICILLLLSYSSITYTSMQLLKPLPVFKQDESHYSFMQVYWSPTMKYFQGRHILYAIIAISCELIIGFGVPLVLIFHRYLIRYCNLNFTSIIPVMDQLKGCYKEEYRWFVAYYLICRQVLYGANNLTDYFLGFQNNYDIIATPFPKFTIMLIVCILIMTVHVYFQPYKDKGLNILDSFILLCLVGLLVSGLEIYWNRMIGVIFWFLPLLIFINYLAFFTGLQYFIIPCSCTAVFGVTFYYATFEGIFSILFLASSLTIFLAYIIYVVKCLYTRCFKARRRFLPINDQNDEVDGNDDNNVAEVSVHVFTYCILYMSVSQ